MNKPISTLKVNAIRSSVFFVGLAAMTVAGWYLVEGMLHFAGNGAAKYIFIAAGIIFQITESICFISAAALTSKSLYWRASLFSLGTILFLFSIIVMTLAQKATLQAGENQADALNLQLNALQAQIKSLDNVITGYQLNAEKQSQSIYANSRELGQDSLNRATELEEKKLALAEKLYQLSTTRRQTSSDFFQQIESITGFPALQTEFYFLISRSLLLELCGIVLMAFAAYLKLERALEQNQTYTTNSKTAKKRQHYLPNTKINTNVRSEDSANKEKFSETGEHWAASHIRLLKQKNQGNSES